MIGTTVLIGLNRKTSYFIILRAQLDASGGQKSA